MRYSDYSSQKNVENDACENTSLIYKFHHKEIEILIFYGVRRILKSEMGQGRDRKWVLSKTNAQTSFYT